VTIIRVAPLASPNGFRTSTSNKPPVCSGRGLATVKVGKFQVLVVRCLLPFRVHTWYQWTFQGLGYRKLVSGICTLILRGVFMHAPNVSGSEMRGSSITGSRRFRLSAVALKRTTVIGVRAVFNWVSQNQNQTNYSPIRLLSQSQTAVKPKPKPK